MAGTTSDWRLARSYYHELDRLLGNDRTGAVAQEPGKSGREFLRRAVVALGPGRIVLQLIVFVTLA